MSIGTHKAKLWNIRVVCDDCKCYCRKVQALDADHLYFKCFKCGKEYYI